MKKEALQSLRFPLVTDYLLMELLACARRGKADLVDAGKSEYLIIYALECLILILRISCWFHLMFRSKQSGNSFRD